SAGTDSTSGGGSGGVATGGFGASASGGKGGLPGSGATGRALVLDSGTESGTPELTPDAACAAETFDAEPAPLNLMVMLDRSCSMSQPESDPLWNKTKAGLKSFFSSSALDGVGVALHYFPTPDTDTVNYCQGDEATPTVQLAKLSASRAPSDAHEQKLFDSMDVQTFNFSGTPLFQALYGA